MIGYQVPTKLLNLFPFKLNRAEMENDSLVEIKQFMRKKTEFALAQKRKKKRFILYSTYRSIHFR